MNPPFNQVCIWRRFALPTPTALFIALFSLCISGCHSQNHQALGTVERDRLLLKATASEIIVDTPAAKGQPVRIGDIIVQLDTSRQQLSLSKAQAAADAAQANLKKLEKGARSEEVAAQTAALKQAQVEGDEAERQYHRAQNLWAKKLISQAEFDKTKTQWNSATAAQERIHQSLLVLTHGSRPEDLAQAQAQYQQAVQQRNLEQRLLDDLSIRATRNAKVDDIPKHPGDRATTGDVLAILLADAVPYARVYIPEALRASVTQGKHLTVHIDGYPHTLDGNVRWVSQDPAFTPYYALNSNDRSRLVYLAEIELPESAREIPSGIPVQVDLPVGADQH